MTDRHGHAKGSGSPAYLTWKSIKSRCNWPGHLGYPNNGGAGITYSPTWETFDGFLAEMGDRPPGHKLKKIDPAGNYTADNCYWAEVKSPPKAHSFYTEMAERFWDHVDIRTPEECWEWTGRLNPYGYGDVDLDKKTMAASRAAWILSNGDPNGLYVLHDCHNRKCVNPLHLRAGTPYDNMQDMIKAGRAKWQSPTKEEDENEQ